MCKSWERHSGCYLDGFAGCNTGWRVGVSDLGGLWHGGTPLLLPVAVEAEDVPDEGAGEESESEGHDGIDRHVQSEGQIPARRPA